MDMVAEEVGDTGTGPTGQTGLTRTRTGAGRIGNQKKSKHFPMTSVSTQTP